MPLPSAGPQPVFGTRLLRRLGLPAVAVKPRTSRRLRSCPKSPTLPARQLPRAKPAGTRGSTSPLPSPLLTYRCAVSGGGGGAKRSRGRGAEQPGRQPRAPGGVALPRPAPPRPAGVGSSAAGRLPAAGRRSLPSLPAVPLLPPASAAALAGRALRSLSQEISVTELPGRGGEAQLCLHVLCSDRIRCDPRSRSSRSHDGGQGLSFLPFRQEGELCLGSADGDQPS